uniref:CHCH domain-containing protein n=1 Tax=Oryza glumipatula TaxID=40148 RepID=A0A0E0BVQ2_9ORYZ
MGRGGRGGGGGGRSSFRGSSMGTKAVPRAAPATTPAAKSTGTAPATKNTSSGSNDSRGMDAVFGPRTVNVVDATPTSSSPAPAAAAAAHPMLDACGAHKKAFQECVAQQGIHVSRCQPYLDMFNDCRRDSAASAAVGVATTTRIL